MRFILCCYVVKDLDSCITYLLIVRIVIESFLQLMRYMI